MFWSINEQMIVPESRCEEENKGAETKYVQETKKITVIFIP